MTATRIGLLVAALLAGCTNPTEPRLIVTPSNACQAWVTGGVMCCQISENAVGSCTYYPENNAGGLAVSASCAATDYK